jgi:hypothetical protein
MNETYGRSEMAFALQGYKVPLGNIPPRSNAMVS